jgi:Peptidase C13 family
MRKFFLALCFCLFAAPAFAAGFSDWAVVLVAGDDHAHSGAPSQVFDNARRDLAKAFAAIGFSPQNMVQFSVDPDKDADETTAAHIANGLWDMSNRATGGCLIYFTSHGAYNSGIVTGSAITSPDNWSKIVNNACGKRPTIVVMSACFSGQFIPGLAADNRMIFTAARPDRTSFGCGESDHYTFFDGCFLQSLPASSDFPGLADKVKDCVSRQEQALGVDYPSEPQISIGSALAPSLRWK